VRAAVLDIDGKVGAEQGTQATVHTAGIIHEYGRMVALGIALLGHDQHLERAELDTKAASFASFLDDVDDALGDPDATAIQRLSPISHSPSSIPL
jgi:hypothetical protein